MQKLKLTIKSGRREMLVDDAGWTLSCIILLQDNIHLHVSKFFMFTLQKVRWKALTHNPYSSDLSPNDFHVFGALEKDIRGHRMQRQTYFHTERRVSQGDKCITSYSDYF